jgi:hypothetical protein
MNSLLTIESMIESQYNLVGRREMCTLPSLEHFFQTIAAWLVR